MSKPKWLFSAAKCGLYYAEVITRTGREEMGTVGELQQWNGNCKRETGGYSRSEKHNIKKWTFIWWVWELDVRNERIN